MNIDCVQQQSSARMIPPTRYVKSWKIAILRAARAALPRHGFARDRTFSIEEVTSSTAVFRLNADEASLLVYPFRFELTIRFELVGPTLSFVLPGGNARAAAMAITLLE